MTDAQRDVIAKDWVVRLEVTDEPDELKPELKAWLETDPENAAAFRRAEALLRIAYAAFRCLDDGAGRTEFSALCQLFGEEPPEDPRPPAK